jgi:hypothetical protein
MITLSAMYPSRLHLISREKANMKVRPLTGPLPRISAPPAIDGIPIRLGRIRESRPIVASNASLPGKTTGFEKCRHMPSYAVMI